MRKFGKHLNACNVLQCVVALKQQKQNEGKNHCMHARLLFSVILFYLNFLSKMRQNLVQNDKNTKIILCFSEINQIYALLCDYL